MAPNPDWVKALKPSDPQGHELLKAERDRSNLSVQSISEFLFSKEQLDRKHRVLAILQQEPVFSKTENYFSGRIQVFERALARAKRLNQLIIKHNWTQEDITAANEMISEPGPYHLHEGMFKVTIREQGTSEQHEKFLRKAESYEYIGCYAQTELGHGSNVRGLETTATWLSDEKCFIIHSPYLTASKWWIGGLGKTANFAVVMAQLLLNGQNYGPHPFVVQIRDLKTHQPLENIHIGDIGPKFGYNATDNGFLLFNKVKIPHISMLARFSRIDPETNNYVRQGSPSLVYGTLVYVRSMIVMHAGRALARGATIAIRYCSIRRQFQDQDSSNSGAGENPVLNYMNVQYRLLNCLAASYALHFTGRVTMQLYRDNQNEMNKDGDKATTNKSGIDLLADIHATSCGLKALASSIAAEGLETCRRACGGHGYSSFSGIGPWYADYLPSRTFDGENDILGQQVARYLLKSARIVLNGEDTAPNDTARILKQFLSSQETGATFDILGNDADIVSAYAYRASFLTFEVLNRQDEHNLARNDLLVDFDRLSKAHSQYLVVKNFFATLDDPCTKETLNTDTLEIMRKLFRLYALHTVEQEGAEFFAASTCTSHQISLIRTNRVMSLMKEIRPHAVRLVDAWAFPDWQLDSSLGRFDGHVYEDLFLRASEMNPLNDVTIDPYPNSPVLYRKDTKTSKL